MPSSLSIRTSICVAVFAAAVLAQGVTDTAIKVGQSCALKGPAAGLGTGMQLGLQVYFDRQNAAGGINHRKIELVTVNDGYEPERCAQATRMLIEQEQVFAMIGGVGTPTAKEALPICTAAKVPFLAPFTGAELLRTPYNRYVVNLRASYYQETEALAQYLVDQTGLKRIACFYQDDAYGAAGLTGIERALQGRKLGLCAKGSYKRNTMAIGEGFEAIAAAHPDAVVLIGAYKPCAEFLKQARSTPAMAKVQLCNISFVGTNNLMAAAGSAGDGSIVSQVVPYPWDRRVPVVEEYTVAMQQAGKQADIGFISLEGYLAAKLFCTVLAQLPGTPSREAFLDAVAASKSIDLGGMVLHFGADDNQGSDAVFLTVVRGSKVEPLSAPAAAPAK